MSTPEGHRWEIVGETTTEQIHRLYPSHAKIVGSVISLWAETLRRGPGWSWTVWHSDGTPEHGETLGSLDDAKDAAIRHARECGVLPALATLPHPHAFIPTESVTTALWG